MRAVDTHGHRSLAAGPILPRCGKSLSPASKNFFFFRVLRRLESAKPPCKRREPCLKVLVAIIRRSLVATVMAIR